MNKQIDINQFSFQVFQSKNGNWGARLSNNGFAVCGFLNVATGDALFSSHPILANAWSVAKRDIMRLGGGQFGKESTHSTRVETVTEVAPVAEIKRGPGRPKGSKTRISADDVQAAPAQAPKSDDMEARMARIEAALLALVS
jgi:hypothetical protein